ncbi:MAG: glutathione S-transferase family protein [Gammaproteobacteria bacterium]
MTDYTLYGFEMSPYSVKVRAFMRYKGIPHQWVVRSMDKMAEFGKVAKLPLVPCVAMPDGSGLQDSTPIMEALEARHPQPPVRIDDPVLDFLSALIEEYADEWGNKPMFHYRWYYDDDAQSAALRIAQEMMPPGTPAGAAEQMAPSIAQRMVPRLPFVGSARGNTAAAAVIEASYRRVLAILEAHLATRPFLFGSRPALADLGLYGQLKELLSDPVPGELMRERAPRVAAFVQRMETPAAAGDGALESWSALAPTLLPLLREEIGARFLPWSDANAKALAAGQPSFTVQLPDGPFTQDVQKYHAKSLAEIRRKLALVKDNPELRAVLADTGCLRWLES